MSRNAPREFPRRHVLHLAAGAAALSAWPRQAHALDYPTRPVRILVGYPAGDTPDLFARLIGQWLGERLGRPFVIENQPGAASNLAAETTVHATADGYTLLLAVSSSVVNSLLHPGLAFDFMRDLEPVGFVASVPFSVAVNSALPVTSIPELIAYAKANQVLLATPGVGTGPHLSSELFKMMTGANFVHVPYRGSYLTDLLSGQVQLGFSAIPLTLDAVKSGRLRGLAVTSATRSEALPDLPTVGESVPGYEASGWNGVWAPKDTAAEIVAKLNSEIRAGIADPQLKTRFAGLSAQSTPMTPAQFKEYVVAQNDKWAKVIKFADIKLE